MDLKKPLTFDEQVEKLKTHGVIVEDTNRVKTILSQTNYYRVTGYALQYRKQESDSDYIAGTNFESIYRIYCFDEALRSIFRKYIEKVEIFYRTIIAHEFSLAKCSVPPHDQHYDKSSFYYEKGYNEVVDSLKREKGYYKDSLIVKHHKAKYNNKMPLWVIVELMSFSNLSKLYNSMYTSEKEAIAANPSISVETLENHLHCMSVLRNKCAHAARLYNTEFNPPARFTSSYLRKHPELKNNSLFAYVLILIKRLPNIDDRQSLIDELIRAIDTYEKEIDLHRIGFPRNYIQILRNAST